VKDGNCTSRGRKRRRSRVWHRWLGFIVVAPLLFVSVTGALLNHANQLGWDTRHVSSDWLLSRYGMELRGEPVTFAAAGKSVSEWNGQLFWDGAALEAEGSLKGVVELESGVAIVCDAIVSIHDLDGAVIEQLGDESLPRGCCEGAGKADNGGLVVRTRDQRDWRFSQDLLEFALHGEAVPCWSEPVQTEESLRVFMQRAYRGEGLTWSRLLLDLHSGRFFGAVGRWIVDLTLLFLVGLSVTGVVLGVRALRPGYKDRDERETV